MYSTALFESDDNALLKICDQTGVWTCVPTICSQWLDGCSISYLTLCIQMDFPIQIAIVMMGLSIIYFKAFSK